MPGHHPANETTLWYLHDSEENYLKKPHPIYDNKSITYTWNSYGYRSDEFEEGSDALMVLGCSHTVGFGLPTEHAWPWLLKQRIDPKLKLYNLAAGGQSNDYVARMAHKTLAVLKPRYLFVLWPHFHRRELQLGEEYIQYSLHDNISPELKLSNHLFVDDGYVKYQFIKNKIMTRYIAESNSVVFHQATLHDVNPNGASYPDLARDHAHNGLPWNQNVCDYFYNML